MKRVLFDDDEPGEDGGLYFASESTRPSFSTGCFMLDLEMGEYSEGQLINIIGDTSTGKSLFVAEAAAEFLAKFGKKAIVRVKDTEDAWDFGYLSSIGIPTDSIELIENRQGHKGYVANTVEAVQDDVKIQLKRSRKKNIHILYVIDSWDVLTNDQEFSKKIRESDSFSSKAKIGGEWARRLWHEMPSAKVTIIIVSQLRDSMDMYGPKYRRSGGKWLDFYCSQILWLFKDGKPIESRRGGVKRNYGRWTRALSTKNRRTGDCEPVYVPIIKGFGVDNLMACVRFLIEVRKCSTQWGPDDNDEESGEKAAKAKAQKYLSSCWQFDQDRYDEELTDMKKAIVPIWSRIVRDFQPRRKKRR